MLEPGARGARLSGRLGEAVGQSMMERGYLGYLSYPVSMNTVTHRLTRATGGVETGLLVAKLPASTTESVAREPTAGQSSSLVLYQPLKPMGVRKVALPKRYRELISNMLDRCRIKHVEVDSVAEPMDASVVKFQIDRTTAVLNCGNRGDLLRLQRINDPEIVVETARFAFAEAEDLQAYILADRFSQ